MYTESLQNVYRKSGYDMDNILGCQEDIVKFFGRETILKLGNGR